MGALAPEATLFQGLKAPSTRALRIGGAKAPPFLWIYMDTLIDPTTNWWNYPVSQDVVVEVRCDSSPWRLKQVRSLIAQMIRQLNENQEKDHPR